MAYRWGIFALAIWTNSRMTQRTSKTKIVEATFGLVLLFSSVVGCQGPWPVDSMARTYDTSEDSLSVDRLSEERISNKTAKTAGSLAEEPRTLNADQVQESQEQAMIAVLDQLQEIEAIDPIAKQELLADLKDAKPENWPLIVEQFQAALAYRQQLAAKEKTCLQVLQEEENKSATQKVIETVTQMQKRPPEPPFRDAVTTDKTTPAKPTAVAVDLSGSAPTISTPRNQQRTLAPATNPVAIQQTSYTAQSPQKVSWQNHLERAISDLELATQEPPGSIQEVQMQMRLRLLRQLAGQDEQALTPISGVSPAMQDYWSKQMFSIATFLDIHRQPDDKRRAAGSLVHLDQARAKLSELATLQIRNLTFVNSVDGYGVYQRRENSEFHPGQQVSLYSEIENFQSTSTQKGYRTLLATSYEVVDLNGQRVEGRDFPEVEDTCQNIRRDFHMQYGIDLPTRIYPGKYELRLVVTDRLSHKIGQASVPFEIVE